MKKKIFIIIAVLMLVATVTACSAKEQISAVQNNTDINQNTVQAVQDEASTDVQSTSPATAEKEITSAQTTDEQKSESQSETSKAQTTTQRPDEQKSSGQNTTTTTGHTTPTTKPTTTKKAETTTKNQTTTQKQTTTKKATTTKKTTTTTTTKKQGLSKADVEWVQSQANAYIKSKGLTVDSSVGSFSGRISTLNYTNRNTLLDKVKEAIDVEYQECIDAGWKQVNMYCKIESRDNGSYFIYVMYG